MSQEHAVVRVLPRVQAKRRRRTRSLCCFSSDSLSCTHTECPVQVQADKALFTLRYLPYKTPCLHTLYFGLTTPLSLIRATAQSQVLILVSTGLDLLSLSQFLTNYFLVHKLLICCLINSTQCTVCLKATIRKMFLVSKNKKCMQL